MIRAMRDSTVDGQPTVIAPTERAGASPADALDPGSPPADQAPRPEPVIAAPWSGGFGPEERWWWLPCAAAEPALNMAFDEALLAAVPGLGLPVLRFYGWTQPAATFGYSQRYELVAALTSLRPLLRRPTGGGLVPHAGDWTYALVFPPTHPWYALRARTSYARLHAWLCRAFRRVGIAAELAAAERPGAGACFAGAEVNDVVWRGAKLAGAAQRRTRTGLLIQGSVQPPAGAPDRTAWESAVRAVASEDWGVKWEVWGDVAELESAAGKLARDKYGRPDYHQRR
jgi:lipoate-protein ligase A